jgi:hypothetical protein
MLYSVDTKSGVLRSVESAWNPKELELEKYLTVDEDDDSLTLSETIFGEPLLLIRNQVRTRLKKRADIFALDRSGNGVVIELKRGQGRLGVETQVLQYLADFSSYTGKNFIKRFTKTGQISEETIMGFLGDNAVLEDINRRSRVVLMARSFDPAIFSLGEWLSSKDIAFRCIIYTPVQISDQKFLSFSVVFDRTNQTLYPLVFSSTAREPGFFWHNIARPYQHWWEFLVKNSQIPACFEDSPGDQGENILTRYIPGDTIVAYAKGFGAVGWGIVADPPKYQLLPKGDKQDLLEGSCRHRLKVNWKCVAQRLQDGIPPDIVREKFGIYHPVSTSVSINPGNCERLKKHMQQEFST